MNPASDIVSRARRLGAELWLQNGDNMIHYRHCPPEIIEQLRTHKDEIIGLLQAEIIHKAEAVAGLRAAQAASDPATAQTFTRLQLAEMALTALIPDEQERRKIRALAVNYAQGWKWSGSANYEHVLSGAILDQIESITGKIIVFTVNADGAFTAWYCKPMNPPPPPKTKAIKRNQAIQGNFFKENQK